MAEIDGVNRFRNPKKLAAYAGLVPSTYSSGGKTYQGCPDNSLVSFYRKLYSGGDWEAFEPDTRMCDKKAIA